PGPVCAGEGAWASRSPAKGSRPLQRRLAKLPPPLQDVRGQAQVRRCQRSRTRCAWGKSASGGGGAGPGAARVDVGHGPAGPRDRLETETVGFLHPASHSMSREKGKVYWKRCSPDKVEPSTAFRGENPRASTEAGP